jgi:hypothetical protein
MSITEAMGDEISYMRLWRPRLPIIAAARRLGIRLHISDIWDADLMGNQIAQG